MKAYCLTGIGANHQVFHNLSLDFEYVPIEWETTSNKETLRDYAQKLCEQVDTTEKFVLIGVSYGGMLATEMNKFITPEKTILISSVALSDELPAILRFLGKVKVINIIPSFLFTVPPFILYWLFGISDEHGKKTVKEIVYGIDRNFTKMSIKKILNWANYEIPNNIIRIHGDSDRLLPVPSQVDYIKVKKGRHFMIGDRIVEISEMLNEVVKNIEC